MAEMKAEVKNDAAKLVVNTNMGLTNVVSIADSIPIINKTLDTCMNILFGHCGPFARYSMLLNGFTAGENFEPSVFTRDGIRVLSAVEFVSPIERYIQELLTYIGGRVDNYAKDGTTTSMLITAKFIKGILAARDSFNKASTVNVAKSVNEYFNKLNKDINTYKFTVEKIAEFIKWDYTEADLIKAASIVAYMQALSSSGGNIQLAECVREIFASSPKMAWDFISYRNSPKESEIPYSVNIPDYDTKFKVSLAMTSNNIFNKGLGTEYEEENVRCIIVPGGIIANDFNTIGLMEYVNEYPSDQSLIIISASIDPAIIRDIAKLNQSRTAPISTWQYMSDMRVNNMALDYELQVALAICGGTPYSYRSEINEKMSDKYTFVAKRVHFFGGYMHIYDTAPTAEGTCLHPYYIDRNTASDYYNDLRTVIEEQLSLYESNARNDQRDRNFLIETLNNLACVHRPTLYVGGTVHEQVANADVVQDVLGAIMSSLKHGFFVNGVWSFMDLVRSMEDVCTDVAECHSSTISTIKSINTDTRVKQVVHSCLRNAAYDVWDHLYKNSTDLYQLDRGSYWNILCTKPSNVEFFIEDMDNFAKANNYPILHPVGIYTELLKRINELAIKFALSEKIIVRGGVVMPEDKQ